MTKRLPCFAVALLLGWQICESQCWRQGIVLADFRRSVSSDFLKHNEFGLFAKEIKSFSSDLRLQLQSSKALEMTVAFRESTLVGKDLLGGVGSRSLHGSLREELDSVRADSQMTARYLIVGRLTDDHSNIVSVDGEVYDLCYDTLQDPLRFRFHVEGSTAEAFHKRMTLSGYLVDQLVQQVEAGLDTKIRVLLTPFMFRGENRRLQQLGGMISALVKNSLTVSQRIRVVTVDSSRGPGTSPAGFKQWTLPELGKREAAQYAIGGDFFESEPSLGIAAEDIDVATGHTVLSKSILVDTLNGPKFYEGVRALGDDIRRAIELDYNIKTKSNKISIAVVASPPYPMTDENKLIALEIASCMARMLRQGAKQKEVLLSVISAGSNAERFVTKEAEKAVIARELDAQFVASVRIQRPVNTFNIRIGIVDARSPELTDSSVIEFDVPMDLLNRTLHSMVRELIRSHPLLQRAIGDSGTSSLESVVLRLPQRTVAVVPFAPYPSTAENRAIITDIAKLVLTKLLTLQANEAAINVVPTEHRFEEFIGNPDFDIDAAVRAVKASYLWTIDYRELGRGRYVHMELVNASNRYDSLVPADFQISHIDGLDDSVSNVVKEIVHKWPPGVNTDPLEGVRHRTEASSVRIRTAALGFLNDYTAVFPKLHSAVEVGAIYHLRPWQFELTVAYDFGKRKSDPSRTMFGRYITLVGRYNISFGWPSRDTRLYGGIGAAMLNVMKVQEDVLGKVVFGLVPSVGVEIPLSRFVFFDVNVAYIRPLRPVYMGGSDEGFINSWSFGTGLGFRIK